MTVGLLEAGFTHKLCIDSDPKCTNTLLENEMKNVVCGDIHEFDFSGFTMIVRNVVPRPPR